MNDFQLLQYNFKPKNLEYVPTVHEKSFEKTFSLRKNNFSQRIYHVKLYKIHRFDFVY